MATLNIINRFSLSANGRLHAGHQGASSVDPQDPMTLTVDGRVHDGSGSLATASVRTIYDDDSDFPQDFDYFWFKADQDCYIQLIGATANVIIKVEANVPIVLPGFDSILAAADTTAITGGTEPTMEDIDSIVIGNYSGSTMSYEFFLVD